MRINICCLLKVSCSQYISTFFSSFPPMSQRNEWKKNLTLFFLSYRIPSKIYFVIGSERQFFKLNKHLFKLKCAVVGSLTHSHLDIINFSYENGKHSQNGSLNFFSTLIFELFYTQNSKKWSLFVWNVMNSCEVKFLLFFMRVGSYKQHAQHDQTLESSKNPLRMMKICFSINFTMKIAYERIFFCCFAFWASLLFLKKMWKNEKKHENQFIFINIRK